MIAGTLTKTRPRATSCVFLERRLEETLKSVFVDSPAITVTEWASENRYLGGSESGRYQPARCHYQAAIQDAFNDPLVREVTWMAAERVGKSTVGSNVLGYLIDKEPSNCLWVMPSRESVSDFLKDEVEPMIRSSEILSAKMAAGRTSTGRTNNARRKSFAGGSVAFVGGGSVNPLSFRTCRVVVIDELDKLKILRGEGDADALAAKRVSTYSSDSKILRFSKPTIAGASRIERHFLRGTMSRYFLSCPACGEAQELGWALLRFDDVRLRCASCNEFLDQDSWLDHPGQWRETVPNPHHKSFTCSVLISPLIRWAGLIEEYRTAIDALRNGDSSLIEVFENSRLGKPYSGQVIKLDASDLYERRRPFY
jgi:phage terminase large subunit GpA-like protein